ncbi:MAG TPA: DAK2 domain-containing protein [Bacillales bacterium]|nr:DAK2 domain-containing protein [Bacillales bacterium]
MNKMDGSQFIKMVKGGAAHLSSQAESIDALNVFPVPDGDTGTNMNLTMSSGVAELERVSSGKANECAQALSKGMLMGARGNSGVILSQLFRGFAKSVAGNAELSATEIADALQAGVDAAYKAVIKPVEGTILTVAKESARRAVQSAANNHDVVKLLEEVVREAKAALKKTPEQLPVLKEVGVVDSGGQGLVAIYEGFVEGLTGNVPAASDEGPSMNEMIKAVHHKKAQVRFETDAIEYGYCTEFTVGLKHGDAFDEATFRSELEKHGDSLLVAADPEWVKVHIHTEKPGEVLTKGQTYGELLRIKIENMREQHRDIVKGTGDTRQEANTKKEEPYGFVTVASGEGLRALFESMGVVKVIEGGQSMNPSTEAMVEAIRATGAKHVFVLPNNGNVLLAARQAAEMADAFVTVVETKSIPEGIAALIAFHPEADAETNKATMEDAVQRVKSGQVTHAVRDAIKDGFSIKRGDYLAICGGEIVAVERQEEDAAKALLRQMVTDNAELVTIFFGANAGEIDAERLASFAEDEFEVDVEIQNGGQPVYSYIVSVE